MCEITLRSWPAGTKSLCVAFSHNGSLHQTAALLRSTRSFANFQQFKGNGTERGQVRSIAHVSTREVEIFLRATNFPVLEAHPRGMLPVFHGTH